MDLIQLSFEGISAVVNNENAQLVSLQRDKVEYMHGGGLPEEQKSAEDKKGWQNSEIVMFPIVGPAKENKIIIHGGEYPLGQHGIARHLPWSIMSQNAQGITFLQEYDANEPVQHGKMAFPMAWSHAYSMEKTYRLEKEKFVAEFSIQNRSSTPMPFMLGWHPAFRMSDKKESVTITANDQTITLDQVLEASMKSALFVTGKEIMYTDDEKSFTVRSDMGKFMLWSPADTLLLCIEPVTDFLDKSGLTGIPGHFSILPEHEAKFYVEIELKK
jgi:galactose mutarotase-like enzyme